MKIKEFDKFVEACRKATLKHFGGWRVDEDTELVVEGNVLSEKAQKVRNFVIERKFDCQTQNVLDLISIVLGEDLGKYDEEECYESTYTGKTYYCPLPGVLFLMNDNPNSHDYGVDKLVLRSKAEYGIRIDGDERNNLPWREEKCYYPPTEEEFDTFFKSLNGTIHDDFPVERVIEENS